MTGRSELAVAPGTGAASSKRTSARAGKVIVWSVLPTTRDAVVEVHVVPLLLLQPLLLASRTVGVIVDVPPGVATVVWMVRVRMTVAAPPVSHVEVNVAPAGSPLTAETLTALPVSRVTVTLYVASLPAVTGFGACAPMVTAEIAANAVSGARRDAAITRP